MSLSAREYLQHIFDETTYIMTSSTSLDKNNLCKMKRSSALMFVVLK